MLFCLLLKKTRGGAVFKFPYKTWLWAGVFLLYPWIAYGAGLGKLTVISALGHPLLAEVDLVSVQKEELTTLTARIAPPDAFQQANIQYSPALIGVRMTIERRPNGSSYIKIVSTRSINDPFLAILVELNWAQGRLLREYTALIDPPGYGPAATPPVAVAPITPPVAAAPAPESKPITPSAESLQTPPPVAPAPKTAAPKPAAANVAKAEASEYAVKRGDTLAKIAAGVKPEGVTLDQMLVSLYRNNSDAFAGNMNRMKTGTILRVPGKERIAETSAPEATKEVRVQSSNWNAYRMKLAEAAGNAPGEETAKSAASGKITTAVEDKAAGKEPAKEVLKLSKGDAPAPGKSTSGKPASAKERVRMMEEEATAREKSLAEANERVAQLEKSIKDMQRLLEIKGVVPPGGKPAPAQTPAKADQVAKADLAKAVAPAKAEPAKAEPAKAEPAKAEPAKAEAPKDAAKAAVETSKPPVTAAADPAKVDTKAVPPAGEAPKAEPVKADDATKAAAAPKPKSKPAAPPPPPPEPGLVDQIIAAVTDPIYLAGGLGGLAVLGGGVFWMRRRRAAAENDAPPKVKGKAAPKLVEPTADAAPVMAAAPILSPVAGSDDVDPLAEADLYLNFGRDAQAEEVLKEALQKNPQHSEAQLKLLQIYAGRKDKVEFEKIAGALNTQTSGTGDTWIKAAGMGYAFDPENSLYEAGKSAPAMETPMVAGAGMAGTDLDFDLELAPGTDPAATDVPLDSGEKTMMMQPGELAGMADALGDTTSTQDITRDSVVAHALNTDAPTPDFTLNVPAGSAVDAPDLTVDAPADEEVSVTDITGQLPAGPMVSAIDFNFDTPENAPAEFKHDSTVVLTPENQEQPAGLTMDFDIGGAPATAPAAGTSSVVQLDPEFKLDLGNVDATLVPGSDLAAAPAIADIKLDDISLTLDDAPKVDAAAPAAEGGAKDDHWYDVQTKFDLAKAYQEMGDKDGAREILQEVIKEGDATQQAEAKQLLDTLG
ncbi:MAG: hypothetical protein JWN94_2826 [Betaproteobacteria bacterium]|nr:hypothetical protein [Betaproteobacteria bacterium]